MSIIPSGSFDRQSQRSELLSTLARLPEAQRNELIADYRQRSEAAFAPKTMQNYRMIIRLFTKWCTSQGFSAEPPIAPSTVATWIDSMGGNLATNTIETRLWGIAELHRSNFLPSPTTHRLVELALKAVKRQYGTMTRQAPPLGKEEVLKAISELGTSRVNLRDKALLWIATDSWCRASEIVAFRVRHLQRQIDGSSLLYIARSKTDPYYEGAFAFLSARGTEAVLQWIKEAGLREDDPIITKSQRGGCEPRSTQQLSPVS